MASTIAAIDFPDLLATVRDVNEQVVAKCAARVDSEGRYPREGIQALREAGLLMLPVAREYGGFATWRTDTSDSIWCNRMFRELARSCSNTAQVFFVHCMIVRPLLRSGAPEQREWVAEEVRRGAMFAVAAAEGGKTILDRNTVVRRVEGGYVLNGTKTFCTGHGEARYVSVTQVQLEGQFNEDGTRVRAGIDCLVSMDQPGVVAHGDWDNMGQRGTTSGSITFKDVFMPDHMVFPTAQSPYYGLILQAAFAAIFLGIGEGALATAAEYVRNATRPYPLSGVERAVDDANIQWHAGDLGTQVHLAALAVDHASQIMEDAECGSGTPSRAEASLAVQKAKIAATNAGLEVTQRMFQMMGARSTALKHGLDIYWRNVRTLTLHDPIDQKYRLVGRNILTGEEPPISAHT